MYLSRIQLDTSKRKTQLALVSPNKFHGAIEEAFTEKQNRNLWRIDTFREKTYLLLLSADKPDFSNIAEQFGYSDKDGESKRYDGLLERAKEGSIWHFRLVANPTHRAKQETGRGKVVAHISEKYQLKWLYQQAEKNGFSLFPDSVSILGKDWKNFKKRNEKQQVRMLEVVFEGTLKVEEETLFRAALTNGIGREKAYGMGLLTIVRTEG